MNANLALQHAMQECQRTQQHYTHASERFLTAWKKAVIIIGPKFFHCESNETVESATHREQLRPDHEAIERYLGVCSVGQGIFIGAVISFFNGDWGADICSGFGFSGIGDVANRLDLNELEIVVELMLNHTGW